MGGSTSKIKKWVTGSQDEDDPEGVANKLALSPAPFVYTRRSSMCYDEDGDLAHEFYEETRVRKNKVTMKKVEHGLVPQGEVERDHPCLSGDIPFIMYQEL